MNSIGNYDDVRYGPFRAEPLGAAKLASLPVDQAQNAFAAALRLLQAGERILKFFHNRLATSRDARLLSCVLRRIVQQPLAILGAAL